MCTATLSPSRNRAPVDQKKARNGEANGRAKLTDGQVRLVRLIRTASSPRPSYGEIGSAFTISSRHAKRLCTGILRREAGGNLESPEQLRAEREQDEAPTIINTATRINCVECGHTAAPSVDEPLMCLACVIEKRQRIKAMRALRGPLNVAYGV